MLKSLFVGLMKSGILLSGFPARNAGKQGVHFSLPGLNRLSSLPVLLIHGINPK
jgi:fermentation-respiration switch protein FrsA (DUF1100 family)